VLLIDDVQFLEGKAHTEEEFFHTFNALYETGGQIVLSCDRPPAALSKLAERLRDRFEWGLRVGLEPPDLPTRVALLDHLVARAGAADAPAPDVLREIARRVPTNFRRLEGALVRITALASISDTPPTPELVRSVFEQHPSADAPLGPPGSPQAREPTVTDVQEAVCAVLHLSSDELLSTRRTPRIVRARQLAMYLARDLTGLSLSRIGSSFGRDHTTVYHAIQKVSASLEPGSDLHSDLDQAKALLAQAHRRATP
jgi:chromosomal replication initiator protein